MPPLTVQGARLSSNTERVLLTLAAADVNHYDFHNLDVTDGEHKAPEHLARSPWGKFPSMTLPTGETLCESRAMATYIAREHAPALLPAADDALAMARFEEAVSAELAYFVTPASTITFNKFIKPLMGMPTDEAAVADARAKVAAHLDVLNGILTKRSFCAGEKFGLADLFYLPTLKQLMQVGEGGLVEERANVKGWWERCLAQNKAVKEYLDGMPTPDAAKEMMSKKA